MASRAWQLQGFVEAMESWGMTDVFLPFILIFAVLFAILQKIKVFGERRNINAVIALVMSLMTVIPHVTGTYPPGFDVIDILKEALPSVSIVVIAVLMLLVLIGIFGGEAHIFGVAAPNWIAILSILTIVFIFGGSAGWWGGYGWFEGFFGSDAVAIIIMLLVFGVIISFVTGEGSKEELGTMKRFGMDFGKIFGGNK
jgi:hypothetical protein